MKYVTVLTLLIVSLLTQMDVALAATLSLEEQERYSLNQHLEFLEDPTGTLTLDEVSSDAFDTRFQSLQEHGNQGVTRSVFWLRTRLDFSNSEQRQWLLQFDYCPIETIKLYLRYPDGTIVTQQSGNLVALDSRPLPDKHFLFPFTLDKERSAGPDKTAEVFLRIDTKGPVIISTSLMTPKAKTHALNSENRVMGLVYGMLLAMILYNLFLYVSIRDTNYLKYVAYIVTASWTLACHDGSFQEAFASVSLWFSHNSIYFSVCASAFFSSWFIRGFLELRVHTPLLDKGLKTIQVAAIALLPLVFLVDNFVLTYIATLLIGVVGAGAFYAGVSCSLQGSRTGRYFLVAWITLILGLFLSCLRYLGLTSGSSLTQYFVHVGVLSEAILLSFALADRINQMRREKSQIQQEANARLAESNLKLDKGLQLQRNFLTAASHELRTPMNGIMGATDLLSDCDSEVERIQYISDIHRSSRKMMSLIENVLDFTDAESGDFRPSLKAFTLNELLEPLILKFKSKAHRKGLNFHFTLEPNDKELLNRVYESYPSVIQKTLNQLLSNSLKFTSRGDIFVTARVNKNYLNPENAKLTIEIRDTGIGMKPATLEDIFIAFQQGDGSFKRQYEGLGIGLSLAKSLMDKLDGTLAAKSTYGKGSTFTIGLKIRQTGTIREAANEEIPKVLHNRATPKPGKNKQVLLVEDNPVNLKVLDKMVEKQGYSTLVAENGEIAVALLEEYKVDLILMDCQMPVMDGYEATRVIRQMHNGNQCVPIIAVTANTLSEDEANCYDAGMNDFVPKPISQNIIKSILNRWLDQPLKVIQSSSDNDTARQL